MACFEGVVVLRRLEREGTSLIKELLVSMDFHSNRVFESSNRFGGRELSRIERCGGFDWQVSMSLRNQDNRVRSRQHTRRDGLACPKPL